MLLSEAFPKRPTAVKSLYKTYGITTVEEAQKLGIDKMVKARYVGPQFAVRVMRLEVPKEAQKLQGRPAPVEGDYTSAPRNNGLGVLIQSQSAHRIGEVVDYLLTQAPGLSDEELGLAVEIVKRLRKV